MGITETSLTADAVCMEAFAAVREIPSEWALSRALRGMARRLPGGCVPEALGLARAMRVPSLKCRTLMALTLAAPPADKPGLLAEAEAALNQIAEAGDKVAPLAALAGYLSGEASALAARRALLHAPEVRDEFERGWLIVSLADFLPIEARLEALAGLRAIEDDGSRAQVLAELSRFLPEPLDDRVLDEALSTARAVADDEGRSRALAWLLKHLPEEERPAAALEALTAAVQTAESLPWARALREAAPYLPAEERARALDNALTLPNQEARAEALCALLPVTPEANRLGVAEAALDATARVGEEWTRNAILTRLGPLLPPDLLPRAVGLARALHDPWARADLLGELAPALLPEARAEVLAEALAAARQGPNPWVRARALTGVAASLAN